MNNISSPRTDDAGIEQLLQAKGKTAARVTPAQVQDEIKGEWYFDGQDGVAGFNLRTPPDGRQPITGTYALRLLTICVLALKNGFIVTGESACASAENFDAEIGRSIARANAVNKIWPLMGYALKTALHNEKTT